MVINNRTTTTIRALNAARFIYHRRVSNKHAPRALFSLLRRPAIGYDSGGRHLPLARYRTCGDKKTCYRHRYRPHITVQFATIQCPGGGGAGSGILSFSLEVFNGSSRIYAGYGDRFNTLNISTSHPLRVGLEAQ
ncbi:hypothetical protein ONZ45_g15104 [Pleurotus djamor]|nr:hypothetical protein ONZ45_g15104 [Pleurotus djamor]